MFSRFGLEAKIKVPCRFRRRSNTNPFQIAEPSTFPTNPEPAARFHIVAADFNPRSRLFCLTECLRHETCFQRIIFSVTVPHYKRFSSCNMESACDLMVSHHSMPTRNTTRETEMTYRAVQQKRVRQISNCTKPLAPEGEIKILYML